MILVCAFFGVIWLPEKIFVILFGLDINENFLGIVYYVTVFLGFLYICTNFRQVNDDDDDTLRSSPHLNTYKWIPDT